MANNINTHTIPRIITGSIDQIEHDSQGMLRAAQLLHSIPPHPLPSFKKRACAGFLTALTEKTPEEIVAKTTEGALRTFIQAHIDSSHNLAELRRRLEKDIHGISAGSSFVRSFKGALGPTIMTTLVRDGKINAFVVKWTDWNEIIANHIYRIGFKTNVPEIACLDFTGGIIERGLTRELISKSRTERLRTIFLKFTQIVAPEKPPTIGPVTVRTRLAPKEAPEGTLVEVIITPSEGQITNQVMLSEKIPEGNLFAFLCEKYKDIKAAGLENAFFASLGEIAFLDFFVVGNLDRLFKFEWDGETCCTYDAHNFPSFITRGSNLGNIIVLFKDRLIKMYTIDNEIHADLLKSPMKENYLEMLQKFMKHPDYIEIFAKLVTECLSSSLEVEINEYKERPGATAQKAKELETSLNLFKADLPSIAPKALIHGMDKMRHQLQSDLVPNWKSEATAPLRQYIKTNSPLSLDSLQERITLFI